LKQDLKQKIISAYESAAPNERERVVAACEATRQEPAPKKPEKARGFSLMKLVAVMSCLVLFGIGILVGHLIPAPTPDRTAQTRVFLDVNPSIVLTLDEDDRVLTCTAENDDGKEILEGLELEGVALKTSLNAIVGALHVNGYLTVDDSSMLVSVENASEKRTSEFLTEITAEVNKIFASSEIECAIIAQAVIGSKELAEKAKANGISVGKMRFLEKVVDAFEHFTSDDITSLAALSIRDLTLLYAQREDVGTDGDEIVSGSVSATVGKEEAVERVLIALGRSENEVLLNLSYVGLSTQHAFKVVNVVVLMFFGDTELSVYEVDCVTGEITAREAA